MVIGFFVFLFLMFVGIFFFKENKFKATSFNVYIISLLIIKLAFLGFDRLKELDLKNLKIVLSELKQTKKDIYAKENDLKNIVSIYTEILFFENTIRNRVFDEETNRLIRKWIEKKTQFILNYSNTKELDDVKKYDELLIKLDSLSKKINDHKLSSDEKIILKESHNKHIELLKKYLNEDLNLK